MFTPQQIDQISFDKAVFGGYDMQSVDEFLEPLTQDYVTLYKENAVLKSKMRTLLGKLEEYRKSESSMREAMVTAQRTCDNMVREAEAKAARLLNQAEADARSKASNADAGIQAEEARLEQAKAETARRIADMEEQLKACLAQLQKIREGAAPASRPSAPAPAPAPAPASDGEDPTDAVADEISHSLEQLVGSAPTPSMPRTSQHTSRTESITSKFTNLQFGRNYDPTKH